MAEPKQTITSQGSLGSVLELDFSADLKESMKGSMHRGTVAKSNGDLLQIIEETPDESKSTDKKFSIAKHSSLNRSITSANSDNLETQTLDGQLSSAPSSNPQVAGIGAELD